MLSFILSFISFIPFFITYKFIQSYSFSEIKRERELERKTLREAGLPEAEEAMRLTSTAHGSPVQRQRRRRQSDEPNADDWSTVYDVDVDLRWGATVATMTTTSSLRRRWRRRDHPWVTGFGFGLCIGDFFFFFDKHLCALSSVLVCLVCWVLILVCFCIG